MSASHSAAHRPHRPGTRRKPRWGRTNQLQPDSKTECPSIPRPLRRGRINNSGSRPHRRTGVSNESLAIDPLNQRSIPLGDLLLPIHSAPAATQRPRVTCGRSFLQLRPRSHAPALGGRQPATSKAHRRHRIPSHLTLRPLSSCSPRDAIPSSATAYGSLQPASAPLVLSAPEASPTADPIHIDLTATRAWESSDLEARPPPPRPPASSNRRLTTRQWQKSVRPSSLHFLDNNSI